jgi:cation:H+ antiporter
MFIFLNSFFLLLLFLVLAWAANFTVKNIKHLGRIFRIRLFVFGILLGIITTLPELSLGISAIKDGAPSLLVGNILGGVVVILSLVLGFNLLINRGVKTDGRLNSLIPMSLVIFSPILLGLNGSYNIFDGLVIVLLYSALVLYLYRINRSNLRPAKVDFNKFDAVKDVFFALLGIAAILVSSNWIVKISLNLLEHFQISELAMGIAVFSIGTNLPELSIVISSWRKKSSELSLSHLFGSSFANVLILGIIAIFQPIVFELDINYWIVALFLPITLFLVIRFYRSDKKMDQREGLILFFLFVLFIFSNIYLATTV